MKSRADTGPRTQGLAPGLAVLLLGAVVSLGSLYSWTGVAHSASEMSSALTTVTIPVEGMVCLSCAASVKGAVKSLDGVSDVEVDLVGRAVTVTYVPDQVSPETIAAAINELGYRAGEPVAE